MIPEGKGMFGWKIKDIAGGDVRAIAAEGKALGLAHASIKVANRTSSYNLRAGIIDDYIPALQEALGLCGIRMTGWVYITGDDPLGEARKGIERVRRFNLDCLIIDAEAEYKQAGKAAAARKYMDALRAGLPDVSLGFCSYRFPSLHPELPWGEFLKLADFHMPQVYWAKAHNSAEQLEQCVKEMRALEKRLGLAEKPIVPAGAAYHEDGWQPLAGEMDAFDSKARAMGLPGVIWWEWGHAERYGFISTIAQHPWEVPQPPEPPEDGPLAALVVADTLNIRSGPGTSYAITGSLKKGQIQPVTAIRYDAGRNEWLRIGEAPDRWICSVYGASRLAELIYG